jgi:hypothetical protein
MRIIATFIAALNLAVVIPASAQASNWRHVFSTPMERLIGREIHVDRASIKPGRLGLIFKERHIILKGNGIQKAGSSMDFERTVDCKGGRSQTYRTSIYSANGKRSPDNGPQESPVKRVDWDSVDGGVLRLVCHGTLP